jgi:hypothetical protein
MRFFVAMSLFQKIFLFGCLGSSLWAQQTQSVPQATSPALASSSPSLSRWLNVQTGLLAARYKGAKSSDQLFINQLQYNFQMLGQFKLDREGRWGIDFAAGTGRAFSSSWNPTGVGFGDFVTNIYLKQLYLQALPWKGVELHFGGIGFNRGESTENTSYSNNGYMMGERLRLKLPRKLYFDEISAATAFLGDIATPNIFRRFDGLSQINYHQFLVAKRFNQRAAFSVDYTSHEGVKTLRQAVKFNLKAFRFADDLLYENYQRVNVNPDWGWSLTWQKAFSRISLAGGFASIDKDYGPWNSDRLGRGRRVFFSPKVSLWHEFGLAGFFTQAFANDFPVANYTRFDFMLTFDFPKALHRAGIL